MRTRAKQKHAAGDRARRENVPRHILFIKKEKNHGRIKRTFRKPVRRRNCFEGVCTGRRKRVGDGGGAGRGIDGNGGKSDDRKGKICRGAGGNAGAGS